MRDRGVQCDVTHRAKEVWSLCGKALTKGYSDPYKEIRDKAGARLSVKFPWDREAAESVIDSLFCVLERDDKRASVGPDVFRYRATHFQVKHPGAAGDIKDLECEIQVMTKAESLWADTTHDLAYKPAESLPDEIKRIYHRLVSLVELFDLEIERAREEVKRMPNYIGAQLLDILLPHHRRLTGNHYNNELSGLVLDFLGENVISDPIDEVKEKLDEFIAANDCDIKALLSRYRGDAHANPFLWQPELLIILFQLERNRAVLQHNWPEILPESLLLSLADNWGVSINPTHE